MGIYSGKGSTRKKIGRQSSFVQGWALAKNNIVSWVPENAVAAGMTNAYSTGGRRITDGLMSIWWFTEGTGTTIEDRAPLKTNTPLTILSGTSWSQDASLGNRYFLNLSAGGHVQASTDELYKAMQAKVAASATNEFSIEAWVKPTNTTQDGPARIITLADTNNGTVAANFMVGQGWWGSNPATVYNTRVRVTPSSVDADGMDYQTPSGVATTSLQHLVLTVSGDDGWIESKLYVDGIEQINEQIYYYGTDNRDNFLGNWSQGYKLDIGNTIGQSGSDRPWLGGIYLMSMYDRALFPGEVKTNYDAGVTTDSVLPLPSCQFDSPYKDGTYARGKAHSIPFSVGGIRSVELSAIYSVSSSDLSSSEYTIDKDLTLPIGPNELGNTISITPKITCSGDGIITAYLNSLSVGSVVSGTPTVSAYNLYVSSMDTSTTVSGLGTRTFWTDNWGATARVPITLSRLHRYDISANIQLSGAPGNAGTYALISGTVPPVHSVNSSSVTNLPPPCSL